MDIQAKDLIAPLISVIAMCIPIGKLLWDSSRKFYKVDENEKKLKLQEDKLNDTIEKQARMIFQVEQNKSDLNGLGQKFNYYVETQEKKLNDLSAQIGHVSDLLTRMEVRMATIIETTAEIKKQVIPREVLLSAKRKTEN